MTDEPQPAEPEFEIGGTKVTADQLGRIFEEVLKAKMARNWDQDDEPPEHDPHDDEEG